MTSSSGSSASSPISLEQLAALNDEIAALVQAGVPLELGLRELGADAGGRLSEISTLLAARMGAGATLVEALRAEEFRLPAMYVTVVEAGLRSGRLPAALEAVSNFARELVDLRRQLGLALVYPVMVCLLAYGLFVVFLVDLVERFRETYEVFRLPVHGIMRPLFWLADRAAWWWWAPPLILLAGGMLWFWSGRSLLLGPNRGVGWIPGIWYFRCANFAELLALLIEHDVPLPESLRLSADAAGNSSLQRSARALAGVVETGAAVSDRDYRRFGFPPFLHWVLAHTGAGSRPARLLRHTADIYRRRGTRTLQWIKLVVPMVFALLIGGGATLLYALAVFAPLAGFWKDLTLE